MLKTKLNDDDSSCSYKWREWKSSSRSIVVPQPTRIMTRKNTLSLHHENNTTTHATYNIREEINIGHHMQHLMMQYNRILALHELAKERMMNVIQSQCPNKVFQMRALNDCMTEYISQQYHLQRQIKNTILH